MRDTVNNNWLNPAMDTVDQYEHAITLMSTKEYQGQERDLNRVMQHINEYQDFKIENVYDIIYKYQPWNFMKVKTY